MVFWGLCFAALGLIICLLSRTKWCEQPNKKTAVVVGIIIFILGCVVAGIAALELNMLLYIVLSLSFGSPLILVGGYGILQTIQARTQVEGTMKAVLMCQSRGQMCYHPIFSYSVNGKKYTCQSPRSYSQKFVERHYKEGSTYSIYINEKSPADFLLQRRISIGDCIMLGCGVFMALVPFGFLQG